METRVFTMHPVEVRGRADKVGDVNVRGDRRKTRSKQRLHFPRRHFILLADIVYEERASR